jgi:hypothetical protein
LSASGQVVLADLRTAQVLPDRLELDNTKPDEDDVKGDDAKGDGHGDETSSMCLTMFSELFTLKIHNNGMLVINSTSPSGVSPVAVVEFTKELAAAPGTNHHLLCGCKLSSYLFLVSTTNGLLTLIDCRAERENRILCQLAASPTTIVKMQAFSLNEESTQNTQTYVLVAETDTKALMLFLLDIEFLASDNTKHGDAHASHFNLFGAGIASFIEKSTASSLRRRHKLVASSLKPVVWTQAHRPEDRLTVHDTVLVPAAWHAAKRRLEQRAYESSIEVRLATVCKCAWCAGLLVLFDLTIVTHTETIKHDQPTASVKARQVVHGVYKRALRDVLVTTSSNAIVALDDNETAWVFDA